MKKNLLIMGKIDLVDIDIDITDVNGKKSRKTIKEELISSTPYIRFVGANGYLELFSSNSEKIISRFDTLADVNEAKNIILSINPDYKFFMHLADFIPFKRDTDEQKQKLITIYKNGEIWTPEMEKEFKKKQFTAKVDEYKRNLESNNENRKVTK